MVRRGSRGYVMASFWNRLIERQILKARAEGKLEGLSGEGAPLPEHPESAVTDAATQVGYRIMAEAGALPEEVALAKQLAEAKAAYAQASDAERKSAISRIADLELRHAIAREARQKFMR